MTYFLAISTKSPISALVSFPNFLCCALARCVQYPVSMYLLQGLTCLYWLSKSAIFSSSSAPLLSQSIILLCVSFIFKHHVDLFTHPVSREINQTRNIRPLCYRSRQPSALRTGSLLCCSAWSTPGVHDSLLDCGHRGLLQFEP